MAPEVTIAMITSGTAVVVALIAAVSQRRTGRSVGRIEEQVGEVHNSTVNSHQTNMRDDVDAVHDDLRNLHTVVERIDTNQAGLGSTVSRLARKVEEVSHYIQGHDAASALIVRALKDRDDALAAELRRLADRIIPPANDPDQKGV